MAKNRLAKPINKATSSVGTLRMVPISDIEITTDNVRKSFDKKKLAELAQSIKENGLVQPLLLHPLEGAAAKYRLVAGERRLRAATEAGLIEVPAYIRPLNSGAILSANLIENLHREDVHPLDEAAGFYQLQQAEQLTVRELARRVSKDARHVARRLALTHLIAEAKADLRAEHITLGHALELCRLDADIQVFALAACYESKTVRSENQNGSNSVPDKTRPARPIEFLQEWLSKHVHLNLTRAHFALDDPSLREDGLTCLACPQRTGHDKLLFADLKSNDTCLNPLCFQAKTQAYLNFIKAEVEAKQGKPATFISAYQGWKASTETTLSRDQYQPLAKKADRCAFAEQAVYDDGAEFGKVQWICREKTCKDHLGRVVTAATTSTVSAPSVLANGTEDRHRRKQELFEMKVNEQVRKRVFAAAIETFTWPLERPHLNLALAEFFQRLPAEVQQTIGEVMGWDEPTSRQMRWQRDALLAALAEFDDHRLAQFLMLCSFAHLGANREGQRQVDQSAVIELSQARGINHALIDAEVRFTLCPKKYSAQHQAYLEAVKTGAAADTPKVYEPATQ